MSRDAIIGSEVITMYSGESQIGQFCLVVELHQGGSATNKVTPSNFLVKTDNVLGVWHDLRRQPDTTLG